MSTKIADQYADIARAMKPEPPRPEPEPEDPYQTLAKSFLGLTSGLTGAPTMTAGHIHLPTPAPPPAPSAPAIQTMTAMGIMTARGARICHCATCLDAGWAIDLTTPPYVPQECWMCKNPNQRGKPQPSSRKSP